MQNYSQTYSVHGMTCAHCAASVTEEIQEIAGVTAVDVDVAAGLVVVTSSTEINDRFVAQAVTEAGYELVS